jgi:hypothetical protein
VQRSLAEVLGHGGGAVEPDDNDCIGPAEEFCRRTHGVFADERLMMAFSPWIDSCAHMCDQTSTPWRAEPDRDVRSVRAPRANWCPGEVTAPTLISSDWSTGDHTFRYDINGRRWPLEGVRHRVGVQRLKAPAM